MIDIAKTAKGSTRWTDPLLSPDAVVFRGDGEPKSPELTIELLSRIQVERGIEQDAYTRGGVVEELEGVFADGLGKETAVFLPTGTLANHLALRRLCGDRRRAVVQEQCHLYHDCGDAATVLSGINLLPLARDRPWFTVDELRETLDASERGRVATPIGAMMIESPVRRQLGRVVPFHVMQAVTELCRERQVSTHLDGARLHMMAAAANRPVTDYTALFDTVYVSLYKYFGAPFGAILAGPAECLEDLYHERRMFGSSLSAAWMAAALALDGAAEFEARFRKAMKAARRVFEGVNELPGLGVETLEHGSTIFPLHLGDSVDRECFLMTLAERGVHVHPDEERGGLLHLTVNTTVLRRSPDEIVAVFANALEAAD